MGERIPVHGSQGLRTPNSTVPHTHQFTRFFLKFAVLVGLFYASMSSDFCTTLLFPICHALTASLAAALMGFVGNSAIAHSGSISFDEGALWVGAGCDAIEPSALFTAAVVSLTAPLNSKVCAILLGLPALFILNVLRVATLAYAFQVSPSAFHILHTYIWPVLFILILIILWFSWALKMQERRTPYVPLPGSSGSASS